MALTIDDLRGRPKQRRAERRMSVVFMAAALLAVVISGLILFTLVKGTVDFLRAIDFDFGSLTDSGWFPRASRFDLRTIVYGTLIASAIAMLVAVPLGLGTAIYLSEYAKPRTRRYVKPVIEVLAGLPSVTIGFFAIAFIAPDVVGNLFDPRQERNLMVAGLGIGLLVIPIMASVSEDALKSVPSALREASYGIGAKKVTTVFRVVLPAAVSGLVAAFIIAISRAIGETMVATMASGAADSAIWRGFNPLQPGMTMTGAMTNAVGGTDQAVTEAPFKVLYFVGALLFAITLLLNVVGDRFVQRVRQKY
jgi:phosphate transport system permease protein